MNRYAKLLIAVIATLYFLWCAANPDQWHFIDNVNLFVHEGGHIVFMFLGQFLYVLGGSLTQIILPLLFVIYFYYTGQRYSAALTLFWVGENLLSVALYAADAVKMQLPLLFGDSSTHDWNWLLIYTGQLHHTNGIAMTIKVIGTITILAAAVGSIYFSLKKDAQVKQIDFN
jgi:hypothetical protein